jgi:predicted RNA-binding Zn-ribbon protein involved in translation (DUF1610 family)
VASYKKACIHCGRLVDPDARVCPGCGSRSPLAWRCPTCLKEVMPQDVVCNGCGRSLIVACPHCHQQTRTNERCDKCGQSLLIQCQNKRCGDLQFFDQTRCNACGKKLEPGKFNL